MKPTCPICQALIEGSPDTNPTRPFCSSRCKLIDLGKWLNEEYRISEPLPSHNATEPELLN